MDAVVYQKLVAKVEQAKNQIAKAEGGMERVKADLLANHKCNTIEEAEKTLAQIDADIAQVEERQGGLIEKLEALTNWETV